MPPANIKRGGHFGVLTEMWVFQNITLLRATNSTESQAKIRLAFHFVEGNNYLELERAEKAAGVVNYHKQQMLVIVSTRGR